MDSHRVMLRCVKFILKGDIVPSAYNLEDLRGDITSLICMIGSLKSDTPKER